MVLLSNTLVLAHGHIHRKIKQITADSLLLDIDEDNKPDIVFDLGLPYIPSNLTHKFDHVINAFAPTGLVLDSPPIEDRTIERDIDGILDPFFFTNVHRFLKPGGLYYTRPKFFYNASNNAIPKSTPNIELLTEKLYQYGFILQQPAFTLTFDDNVMDDFIVFKALPVPDEDDILDFLKLQIQQNKVKYLYEKVHQPQDDEEDSFITYDRFAVKNVNLDQYFAFLPNYLDDLLEYSYIKFDDTKVELIYK